MSLFNKYEDEENEILGIFKTNAMVISDWKSALFPKICRANHSCVPNLNYVWNSELGQQQMFAVKKVSKLSFTWSSSIWLDIYPKMRFWSLSILAFPFVLLV